VAEFTLRPYAGGDEAEIVDCWNRSAPADPITARRFVARVLLDPNFEEDGLIVARDGSGRVVGFVHAVVRHQTLGRQADPDDGWICALMVDPEARGRGLGHELLRRGEDYIRSQGRRRASMSPYAPNYHYPGVEVSTYPEGCRLFETAGYRVTNAPVAMDRSLVDFTLPADVIAVRAGLEREGWRFGPVDDAHVVRLLRFCAAQFSQDWTRALRDALAAGLEPNRLWIATRAGQVYGFAMFGGYDGIGERFGPFGVDADLRGIGLGKVLLYEVLREMKATGLHGAWFLWTGEERPAGHLYRRAGFAVTRRFHVYQRTLTGSAPTA
jgi:mycothiol synthase